VFYGLFHLIIYGPGAVFVLGWYLREECLVEAAKSKEGAGTEATGKKAKTG